MLLSWQRCCLELTQPLTLTQDIRAPSGSADPNNMTLLAEEARALADR